MTCSFVTSEGKLRDDLLPAVYFDANVLIHFFLAEELIENERAAKELEKTGLQREDRFAVLRDVLRAEKYVPKMIEIIKILEMEPSVMPIYTPLGMVEFMGAYSQEMFKNIATDVVGNFAIERMSRKHMGDAIKAILLKRAEEYERQKEEDEVESRGAGLPEGVRPGRTTSDLELLIMNISLNQSFIDCNRFRGLLFVDIVKLDFTGAQLWGEANLLAYLQLGLSDIMHIMAARHLGCTYFASFDEDFKRAGEVLKEIAGIDVLTSPDMILNIL